jgi:hypothetical protein
MGSYTDNPGPIVRPAKQATKVNIGIIVGVLVFIAVGCAAIAVMRFLYG